MVSVSVLVSVFESVLVSLSSLGHVLVFLLVSVMASVSVLVSVFESVLVPLSAILLSTLTLISTLILIFSLGMIQDVMLKETHS